MKRFIALLTLLTLACEPATAQVWAPRGKTISGGGSSCPAAPLPAQGAGYCAETFSANLNFTASTVDTDATYDSGFAWYPFNCNGVTGSAGAITLNSDGSASVTQASASGYNATLASAGCISGSPFFVGTAFGGGGYFEATVKVPSPSSVNGNDGWPSWWMSTVEILNGANGGAHWSGQATNYNHFSELDPLEYTNNFFSEGVDVHESSIHDWYGIFNSTCPSPADQYCQVDDVQEINSGSQSFYASYHRYGVLWTPATASKRGGVTFYVDGVQEGATVQWTECNGQSPPPAASPPVSWTYCIIDSQHLDLLLGAGTNTPMQIESVVVWQTSAANNLHN